MKVAFIPIDNRPVCFTLPQMCSKINSEIEFFIPNREWLGGLTKYADIEKIFDWLDKLDFDAIILSLDTIAYGGLISSRRSCDSFEQIAGRVNRLKNILEKKSAKIYAFSSIMRISNNNINEEEKEYWSRYGKKIFDYSVQTHKLGCESCIANLIPSEILDDYMTTRKRNFEINKLYLKYQKQGFFDVLIFSKDDCCEYGFNVQEAQALEKLGGYVKTGADEIPLTLFTRAVNDFYQKKVKIASVFLAPQYKNLVSNYEDISIEKSVNGQIELSGCMISPPDNADILLYVNNFETQQGEIVMKIVTKPFDGVWCTPQKPYMIADVRYANGADNHFVQKLFDERLSKDFYGYSAWNTSANSLGSLICGGVLKYLSKQYGSYNSSAFRQLQAVRFLDDWAYQANVRQNLTVADVTELKQKMIPFEKIVCEQLNIAIDANYSFPWQRLFEVEINGIS